MDEEKKTPEELFAYQTELLEQIAANQRQILDAQDRISIAQGEWLKSIDGRVKDGVKYLNALGIVVTCLGLLLFFVVIGILQSVDAFIIK